MQKGRMHTTHQDEEGHYDSYEAPVPVTRAPVPAPTPGVALPAPTPGVVTCERGCLDCCGISNRECLEQIEEDCDNVWGECEAACVGDAAENDAYDCIDTHCEEAFDSCHDTKESECSSIFEPCEQACDGGSMQKGRMHTTHQDEEGHYDSYEAPVPVTRAPVPAPTPDDGDNPSGACFDRELSFRGVETDNCEWVGRDPS